VARPPEGEPQKPGGDRTATRAVAARRSKSPPAAAPAAEHLPGAVLHHHIPGRARLRVPSRRGDRLYFQHIAETLAGCAAVAAVDANPATAGVLIAYHGDLRTVLAYARDHSLFKVGRRASQMPLGRHLALAFGRLDKRLLSATGGALDLSSVVFLTLFGAGAADLLRGHFARAMTLLAHAGVALLVGQSTGLAATEAKELAVLFEGE
jgi:hypothetical protein